MADRAASRTAPGPDADFLDVGEAKPRSVLARARWIILMVLLAFFSVWTFLAVSSGSPGDVRQRPVALTTLATLSGPLVGAIARDFQSCCLEFSLVLAAICGPILALGLLAQVIPLPFRRGQAAFRLALWTLGWLAWFLGGPVSFAHALF